MKAPIDVEELSRLGGRRGVCPYYASRAAVPAADFILLPYSALLSQVQARHCKCNEKQRNAHLGECQLQGPLQLLLEPPAMGSLPVPFQNMHGRHGTPAQDSMLVIDVYAAKPR